MPKKEPGSQSSKKRAAAGGGTRCEPAAGRSNLDKQAGPVHGVRPPPPIGVVRSQVPAALLQEINFSAVYDLLSDLKRKARGEEEQRLQIAQSGAVDPIDDNDHTTCVGVLSRVSCEHWKYRSEIVGDAVLRWQPADPERGVEKAALLVDLLFRGVVSRMRILLEDIEDARLWEVVAPAGAMTELSTISMNPLPHPFVDMMFHCGGCGCRMWKIGALKAHVAACPNGSIAYSITPRSVDGKLVLDVERTPPVMYGLHLAFKTAPEFREETAAISTDNGRFRYAMGPCDDVTRGVVSKYKKLSVYFRPESSGTHAELRAKLDPLFVRVNARREVARKQVGGLIERHARRWGEMTEEEEDGARVGVGDTVKFMTDKDEAMEPVTLLGRPEGGGDEEGSNDWEVAPFKFRALGIYRRSRHVRIEKEFKKLVRQEEEEPLRTERVALPNHIVQSFFKPS